MLQSRGQQCRNDAFEWTVVCSHGEEESVYVLENESEKSSCWMKVVGSEQVVFHSFWSNLNESIQGDLPIQNRYFSILHAGWCILLVKFCLHSVWILICSEWLNGYGSIFLSNMKDSRCRNTILRNLKKTNQKRTGYVSILNGGFCVLQGASLFQFFFAKNKRQKKDWGLLHYSAEKCWKWKEKAKPR